MKKVITTVLVIAVLWNCISVLYAAESGLSDINKNWAKDNIQYLYNLKYVAGYPDGTYKPNNPVAVIEFVKLATLAAGFKLESGHKLWYENYLNKALETRIITEGEYPDLLAPLTREQVAKIAVAAVMLNEEAPSQVNDQIIGANFLDYTKISDDKKQEVITAYNLGLMEGLPDATFNPHGTLTRAEMCTVILRIMDKTKRRPFVLENSHAIILSNTYTGKSYTISRPEKKEEIQLAYLLQRSMDKSKGWYDVSYNGRSDISSAFYDSEESFKQSSYNMRMGLSIDLSCDDNISSTYYMTVYEPKKVKGVHKDVIVEMYKHLFEKDYEKAMAVFDKYLEEGVSDTAQKSNKDYTFNNRKMNVYRSTTSGQFTVKIYKKVK